jgi:hypothetical protein
VLTTEINGERTGKQTKTRVYGATVQDRAGKLVDHDAAVITSGAKFVSNTRLKPGEKRTENFSFKIDPDENVQIRTVLTYLYEPFGSGQSGLEIEFSEKYKESLIQYTQDRIGKD